MANLFIPTPDHHLNAFRRISGRYHANNPQPEGNYEYIGAVASVGLLTGLIAFFWSRNRFSTLSKFGFLLMAGLLYATVGGFSSMFAVLVTPLIRAPNRISPFLACFGLMIVGFGLQRLKTSIRNRYLWWGLIGALGVLGLADQIPSGAKYNNTAAELSSDITFVQQIEKDVSTGGAILQLPFMSFPESYPINDMADYSHLRGYLFSEKLSWSYGAVRGRPASAKIEALSREPLDLEAIRRAGYTGIYIDRFGYARHEATSEAQLIRELKQQPLESPDKRLCFFKL
jgi:phosphoglycerol transferase